MPRPTRLLLAVSAALVAGAIAVPHAAPGNDITPPPVPSDLQVPAGQQAFLIGHARGTQNFMCVSSGSGFAWAFFGPQATLFDDASAQQITHFLSANPNPADNGALRATWQHSGDTSAVWAVAVASSTDANYVAPGAIPWLKLQVVGAQYGPTGGAKLVRTAFIQRVNTSGGMAPTAGCSAASDIGKKALVSYTADYVFYRS